jgi:phosphorylase kinase alpha/beta subunit
LDCAREGTIGDIQSLREVRTDYLRALIAKGRQRLEDTLPFESPPERFVDSALLFLIHPLRVLRPRPVQDAILILVPARLKGDVGIKRYAGDSSFCQDYDEWFPPEEMSSDSSDRLDFRDALLQPNCEAQWCIFDPLLSIFTGKDTLRIVPITPASGNRCTISTALSRSSLPRESVRSFIS